MATTTIRLDDELLKTAKKHKVNVSEAARFGIEEMIRRRRIIEASERLAKLAVKPDEPSEVTIRRLRDEAAKKWDRRG